MLILTCTSKLQLLEGVLKKSLPQALLVCGAVMHINRGNPAQHEVVVDSWPEFKVVLTRPRAEVVKDNRDSYTNLHAAFYRDVDACQALLENTEAVDWGRALQLQGLQDGVYEIAKDIAEARHVNMKSYLYETVQHPDPSTTCPSRFKGDLLHFGTLNSSHATLINETWSIGGNEWSLRYLDGLIHLFPSACLLNKEDQLVSWVLSDPVGCLTHAYTLPQYRGQRYNTAVGLAVAKKLYAKGFAAYGGVLPDNQPAKVGVQHQGFHTLPFTKYVLLCTPRY